MYGQRLLQIRVWVNRVWLPKSAEQKTYFLPSPSSRLRNWSRETGSAVLFRVSPLIIHTQAVSGTYSRDSSPFSQRGPQIYCQSPSGQSRIYQVTPWCAEGVNCRESSGIGPVIFEVVRVRGAAYSGNPTDKYLCPALFPQPLLVRWSMSILSSRWI